MDGHHHKETTATVKDPVCGMDIDPGATGHHAEHGGVTYYFCSAGCREKFLAEPQRYAGAAAQVTSGDYHGHGQHAAATPNGPVDEDAEHTCPMHPEIRQIGPGSCPICGMGVEPRSVRIHLAILPRRD